VKVAYFDCFSGISGDMTLGALVDAGLDRSLLMESLNSLGLEGFNIEFKNESRGCIAGVRADVTVMDEKEHRHLPRIEEIINGSSLSDSVKYKSCQIFQRLAVAEAAVHGQPPEKVHFHEVGALDAIIDIVGAVAGLEIMGIDKVYCSDIALGKGYVKCMHGVIPIPAPAVSRLVQDFKVRFTQIERELTTPTGAAIITTLTDPIDSGLSPSFVVKNMGYGLGFHQGGDIPNALRIILGETCDGSMEEVIQLETNLDDIPGELAGYLIERCLEGALDAYTTPIQMKKSRPGLVFSAIAPLNLMDRIRTLIHEESGSLGVRMQKVSRSILERETFVANTTFGQVTVKRSVTRGLPDTLSPEHDDIARIARENSIPYRSVLKTIMDELES